TGVNTCALQIFGARAQPAGEGGAMEARQLALAVDTHDPLHEGAVHAELVEPVGEWRAERAELADQRGVAEHSVLQADARAPRLGGPRAQHQPREVHGPAVRGRVRAVVE